MSMADLVSDSAEFESFTEQTTEQWRDRSLDELVARRAEVATRTQTLQGYAHRSAPQDRELQECIAEQMALDSLIGEKHAAVRAEKLERVRSAAADPRNREAGAARSLAGDRPDDPRAIWRNRGPWTGLDEVALRSESIGRAHSALEAISDDAVPRDAKQRLAEQFDDPAEQGQASRLALALSDPHYTSAYRSMLRDPLHGDRYWTDPERDAMRRVNTYTRAMTLGTASLGYALPLVLDPGIILTNASSANPWRQLATIKTTTSNTWNGVTSTGAAAQWLGEGAAAADGSPTLTQLQITPQKGASWIFGSWESIGSTSGVNGDVDFAEQLPMILGDAKDRLEEATFTTGAGTGAIPTGFFTTYGTANDATVAGTATRAATDLYGLLETLTPRFRLGQSSRLAFLSSLVWLDKYRQVPRFSGATESIVNDAGTRPMIAGVSWYEESTMTTGTAATSRVFAVGDWSQVYIADRWPGFTVYEPFVTSQATGSVGFPTAQSGWFYVWRTNLAITTTNAFKVLRLT
jgi:HK97 family phage major capsid protein